MGSAVKLSDAIVAAARAESKLMSRSMTQQIEHWARIETVFSHPSKLQFAVDALTRGYEPRVSTWAKPGVGVRIAARGPMASPAIPLGQRASRC